VYRSASYTIARITSTRMPWDAEEYDTDGFHDNATNNERLTVPTGLAGKYHVSANIGTDNTGIAINRWIVQLRKNGTYIRGSGREQYANSSTYPNVGTCADVDLAEGDYVDVEYYQDGSSTRNFFLAQCAFSMHKIG
jgi:hypothetical protein